MLRNGDRVARDRRIVRDSSRDRQETQRTLADLLEEILEAS
jgi:hypothetical protein